MLKLKGKIACEEEKAMESLSIAFSLFVFPWDKNPKNETVADIILALMISTARRMPELDAAIRIGAWQSQPDDAWFGADVHHKTLRIIGMGTLVPPLPVVPGCG